MGKLTILRKRYFPDEVKDISGDEIIYRDEEVIITKWDPIRPRMDFAKGTSCAFLNEGYKISKFFDEEGNFIYWYCDIIDAEYKSQSNTLTLHDLLVDIKVFPDGRVFILDGDELADALENNVISQDMACKALRRMDKLLKMIYEGKFPPAACGLAELKSK